MAVAAADPISLLGECPDCFEPVLSFAAQGGLRLNWPAEDRARNPAATWSLIDLGGAWIAGNGADEKGAGHALHRHQPPEAHDERLSPGEAIVVYVDRRAADLDRRVAELEREVRLLKSQAPV